MLFSSATFLFVFLPLVLVLYFVPLFKSDAPAQYETTRKNLVLCLASLVFYAWGEPVYIILMLVSIYFNYNIVLDMQRYPDLPRRKKVLFVLAVVFNLFVLGFFKYEPFVVENINRLFSLELKAAALALPVGISFYTFQILSYVIDVYKGECEEQTSLLSFATYITMFPQLIAGPIVQYGDIEKQLSSRTVTTEKFAAGVLIFIRGLGKKMIFANTIGAVYTEIQSADPHTLGAATAWFGILCYTLQIYFDFSGYSDMAIGLGKMFGFELPENFNFPYTAVSIKDFWSRWHISLSGWFRKYVYIPLGGNRKGTARTMLNILIVWSLTGLWHGAAWNFVAWGAYYGVLLLLEKYVFGGLAEKLPKLLRHVLTLFIVVIGWVFFSAESFPAAWGYLCAMFGFGAGALDSNTVYLLLSNLFPFVVMVLSALGAFAKMPRFKNERLQLAFRAICYAAVFAVCTACLVSDSYNPFLYFRF